MTRQELQERIYGDYYKSEEERNAFIRDYLKNYKAPKVKSSPEEISRIVDGVFKKAHHDQIKRNAMRALAMDRALHTRMSI
jgi:hypothetical protein